MRTAPLDLRLASGAPSIISLRGVTKTFEGPGPSPVHAVDAVDLDVAEGEFVMLTGRSGSGKTTLLNLVAGLAVPSEGTVIVEGTDIWSLTDRERARRRNQTIGFVFQFPSLVPNLTVAENVMLPMTLWPDTYTVRDRERRTLEVLSAVDLDDRAAAWPRQLSAGQQQRAVLARALVRRPRLILADEPTSNLDEATEAEVMEVFRAVHLASGVTILMVTHTSELVGWGTRSARMASGRITEDPAVLPAGH